MRPLVSPLASLAMLALLVAALPVAAASGSTQIVQQRLTDGRILLTDHPVRGATTERSWQMANEDPAAARQRAADVRAEAKEVSERVQRMLDRERRADEDRERTRLAALAMAAQSERNDEPVYYGGGVVPYGYGAYGVGAALAAGRGHGRVGHHGKFPATDRWGSTEKFGTVGKFGRGNAPASMSGGRSPMFGGR